MKTIITLSILAMLLLAGCGEDPEPVQQYDYKPFLEQNTALMNQNTQCLTEKATCIADLKVMQDTNNELKLQILNQNTTTISTSNRYMTSTTCTRLLMSCEERLEDCWFESNATTTVINHTYYNSTMANALDNCTAILEMINESLQ